MKAKERFFKYRVEEKKVKKLMNRLKRERIYKQIKNIIEMTREIRKIIKKNKNIFREKEFKNVKYFVLSDREKRNFIIAFNRLKEQINEYKRTRDKRERKRLRKNIKVTINHLKAWLLINDVSLIKIRTNKWLDLNNYEITNYYSIKEIHELEMKKMYYAVFRYIRRYKKRTINRLLRKKVSYLISRYGY